MGYSEATYEIVKAVPGESFLQTGLVVLYLIEGEMDVRCYGETVRMLKEDILAVNSGMEYQISGARKAIYGIATFSISIISQVMDRKSLLVSADSARDRINSYQDLRDILRDMSSEYVMHTHSTDAAMSSLLFKLLDCLIENYQLGHGQIESADKAMDVRMSQMMQYIITHIQEDFSLSDLASQMFLSTSTLSRFFKNSTGIYFADYVMRLRIRMSLGLLRNSNQNLTQIAMNSGFATPSAFNRSFRKVMGMMPSEYRKQYLEKGGDESARREVLSLREELRKKGYQFNKQEYAEEIRLDLDKLSTKPFKSICNTCINIGSMYEFNHAKTQLHALELNEKLHFQYFRIWNIFSDKLLISDGETLGSYNFDMVFQVLDFMVFHRLKPYMDFGRRPDTVIKSGENTVYYFEGYISFKSRAVWEDLFESFIDEIVRRYGLDEVSTWLFELSRDIYHELEGSGMYADADYDFFKVWQFFYRVVRDKVPGAKIGGISSVLETDADYPQRFFSMCVRQNCPPDFVSMCLYPYELKKSDIVNVNKHARVGSTDPNLEKNRVHHMRDIMKNSGLGHCELYISEWNNSIGGRNTLNDSCFRSSYLISKYAELYSMANMIAVMAGTDWISHYADSSMTFFGGIGLLSKDGISKPAFYALSFIDNMGTQLLSQGNHYILTKKPNGDLYMLCWNFSWFRQSMLSYGDDIDVTQLLSMRFEDERTLELDVYIKNLPAAGGYTIKKRLIGHTSGSVLDAWSQFGLERRLNWHDIQYIRAISAPGIEMSRTLTDPEGNLGLKLSLKPHEAMFVQIFKNTS